MIPILFPKKATDFTTNGVGRLSNAVSCNVVERLNGAYDLEMVYPESGIHFKEIGMGSIIYAIHDDNGDCQPFFVYKITKPINGKSTIYAHHISYRLNDFTVKPFQVAASATACNDTLQGFITNFVSISQNFQFSFWTDVTTIAPYTLRVPAIVKTQLGGTEGSVLDQFGGEYEWDGFTVKLHSHRGNPNTGIVLNYGKNITDITQEEEISNTVTGVFAYWANMDQTDVITDENVASIDDPFKYGSLRYVPLDLSDRWDEKPSVADLHAAAQAYVNQDGFGVPKVSIDVSFVALWQTEEYKDIAPLEKAKLGDTITVHFDKLGVDATARIVGYDYNVLKQRYNKLQVGSIRSSFASVVNDQNAEAINTANKSTLKVGRAVDEATAWLTSGNGYIVALKGNDGEWKELLAMDTPDTETATKVMRLNENGIGGSKNGISGPYQAAMLVDGTIVASMIKAGVLTDLAGKFSLNMETGSLSMQDGTFSGTINGSVVQWGDSNISAKMYWKEITSGVYVLEIEGLSSISGYDKTLRLDFDTVAIAGNIGNAGKTITTKDVTASGNISASGSITATNKVYSEGYEVARDVTNQHVNIGVFESGGSKYLGVYKGTTVYGNVKLT